MSMKTIVALFEARRPAIRAVRELIAHGIAKERISFVSRVMGVDMSRIHLPLDDQPYDDPAAHERLDGDLIPNPTAAVGATLGIGSVLLGVAFLSLPAVGPVLAAGPLLAGIMASASAGGTDLDLPQRLSRSGMPASDAERYAQAVRSGGALVVLAIGDEDAEDAAIILARHAPIDPEALRARPLATAPSRPWPGAARPESSAARAPRHHAPPI